MQIIVNCFVRWNNGIVMLRKPKRGWWVLPGGKVEPDELWPEAASREVFEETGLRVDGLKLRGIHSLRYDQGEGEPPIRRLIVQFTATSAEGTLFMQSKEGLVSTVSPQDIDHLPMDNGDKVMIEHTLWAEESRQTNVFFGRFSYNSNYELLDWEVTPRPAEAAH